MIAANPENFTIDSSNDANIAKSFMASLNAHLDGITFIERGFGNVCFALMDHLFDILTQDEKDFGPMISFQSEETPFIEDVMVEADKTIFNWACSNYYSFELDVRGFMTRKETEKAFWSILCQQMLMGNIKDYQAIKNHCFMAFASMFTGMNPHGIQFTLRYVEQAPLGEKAILCSGPLNEFLL